MIKNSGMKYLIYVFWILILGLTLKVSAQPGRLDSTFDSDGISQYPLKYFDKLLVQPNGKIICKGGDAYIEGQAISLMRCHPDGSYDLSFGVGGFSDNGFNNQSEVDFFDFTLLSNGSILCAGFIENQGILYKVKANGLPDSSYGVNGVLALPFLKYAYKLQEYSPTKLLILGADSLDEKAVLFQLNANGHLDKNFGTDGIVPLTDLPASDLVIQNDGKILVGGAFRKEAAIKRFHMNGTPDSSFASLGVFKMSLTKNELGKKLLIQKNQQILFLSSGLEASTLIRLNSNGYLDSFFAKNGLLSLEKTGKEIEIGDMTLQQDGKILVFGNVLVQGDTATDFWLERYETNGDIDLTFGDSGTVVTRFYKDALGKSIAFQKDGKIVVGGRVDYYAPISIIYDLGMVRYLSGLNLGILDFFNSNAVMQVSPNPIQSSSTLSFSLLQAENLSIDLFNLQGQKVKSFINQQYFTPGEHNVDLSFDDIYTTGYYLLRINNGKQVVGIRVLKQ